MATNDAKPATPARSSGTSEVERLREENARLRRQLADAGRPTAENHVPDFLPEGTREELERTGEAVNPFNGEKLTKSDAKK